jgi:galactonate dehydratase
LDLNSKRLGVPAYELLGGKYRDEIELYANYWFLEGDYNPDDYARNAREVVKAGFTALKFDPFAHVHYNFGADVQTNMSLSTSQEEFAVQVVAAVRDGVGDDITLLIETHALLNAPTAVRMAELLTPYQIGWYEEPTGPEIPGTLRAIRERVDVPLAVGERHYTRFGIRSILEGHLVEGLDERVPPDRERVEAVADGRPTGTDRRGLPRVPRSTRRDRRGLSRGRRIRWLGPGGRRAR